VSAQPWQEHALAFDCRGQQLVGVLTEPAQAPTADTGVVIVTGGPQYRAGAHRMFVRLARALAGAGYPALRFDLRGMGDSEGDFPGFEHTAPDVGAAIAALRARCPQLRQVVLWGLCDGASAALLYLHATRDRSVRGLCLVNPWVRSAQSLARTHVKHYYAQRLLQREFWLKLLRGGVGAQALRSLAADLRGTLRGSAGGGGAATFQQRMARAWSGFDGALLLLLSGQDYTAKEFLAHAGADACWRGALQHPRLRREDCPQADHTFSTAPGIAWLLERTLCWLQAHPSREAADFPPCAGEAAAALARP
jgi:exosortase A-associated hydrolase 1